MPITKLINPKSQNYYNLKNYVLSSKIGWYYFEDSTQLNGQSTAEDGYSNLPFYGHCVIHRPLDWDKVRPPVGLFVPEITSPLWKECVEPFLQDLGESNGWRDEVAIKSILRVNINAMDPSEGTTVPHLDHLYIDHKNILVYFTDAGGDTIVDGVHYSPQEDDIISFGAEWHCLQPSKFKRRVVMIVTFI